MWFYVAYNVYNMGKAIVRVYRRMREKEKKNPTDSQAFSTREIFALMIVPYDAESA